MAFNEFIVGNRGYYAVGLNPIRSMRRCVSIKKNVIMGSLRRKKVLCQSEIKGGGGGVASPASVKLYL